LLLTSNWRSTYNTKVDSCLSLDDFEGNVECESYQVIPEPDRLCYASISRSPLLDEQDKQIVMVLENNGWHSQALLNELLAVILQEGLGVGVVLNHQDSPSKAAERIGLKESHAVLEYWPEAYRTQTDRELVAKRISKAEIGYTGEVGLWVSQPAWIIHPDSLWLYPEAYAILGENGAWQNLPRNDKENSIPNWTYEVNSVLTLDAMNCTENYCQYGQYFPPQCPVDPSTRLTNCSEVYLENPSYSRGVFETLLSTYNMKLTAVYLGLQQKEILNDMYVKQVPSLFYAFKPGVLLSSLDASRLRFHARHFSSNASFDSDNPSPLTDALYQDFPTERLLKLWSAAEPGDQYFAALNSLLASLTVSEAQIEEMLRVYQANRVYPFDQVRSDLRSAVCSMLQSDSTLRSHVDTLLAIFEVADVTRLGYKSPKTTVILQAVAVLSLPIFLVSAKILIELLGALNVLASMPMAVRVFRILFSNLALALLLWLSWYYSLFYLLKYPQDYNSRLNDAYLVLSWMCFSFIAYSLIRFVFGLVVSFVRFLTRDNHDGEAHKNVDFLEQIIFPTMLTLISLICLIIVSTLVIKMTGSDTIGVLLTSALGFAFAFGLSDVFKDYVNGIILITSRLYSVGDWVTLNGIEGSVVQIGLRRTHVQGFNMHMYIINNRDVLANVIINNASVSTLKISLSFRIHCDSDPGQVQKFIQEFQRRVLTINGITAYHEIYVGVLDETGYLVNGSLYTNHAPSDDQYNNLKQWGYPGIWWKPFLRTKGNVSLTIGHLLRKHKLRLAGGLRIGPMTDPLPIHKLVDESVVEWTTKSNPPSSVQTDLVLDKEDPDEVKAVQRGVEAPKTLSMFTTSLNMQNKCLPSELDQWLPFPGVHDLVVVAVQENSYYTPPSRDADWVIFAHKRIPYNQHTSRCHFDFLAVLVNYFGSGYVLLDNVGRKGASMAVLLRKAAPQCVSTINSHCTSNELQFPRMHMAALSLQVCCTQMLLVNLQVEIDPSKQSLKRNHHLDEMFMKLGPLGAFSGPDPLAQFHSVVLFGHQIIKQHEDIKERAMLPPHVHLDVETPTTWEPAVAENSLKHLPEAASKNRVAKTNSGWSRAPHAPVSEYVWANHIMGKSNSGSNFLVKEPLPKSKTTDSLKNESLNMQPVVAVFVITPHKDSSTQCLEGCLRAQNDIYLKSQTTEDTKTLSFKMASVQVTGLKHLTSSSKTIKFYLTFHGACLAQKTQGFQLFRNKEKASSFASEEAKVELNSGNEGSVQFLALPKMRTYIRLCSTVPRCHI